MLVQLVPQPIRPHLQRELAIEKVFVGCERALHSILILLQRDPWRALFSGEFNRGREKRGLCFRGVGRQAASTEPFGDAVEPEAWLEPDGLSKLDERMFVARAVGRSMEPTIHDGDFVVFRSHPAGTRQGKIVLAQYRGPADPDTGGSFTVKKYSSERRPDPDTEWQHERIVLSPLNRDYQPIVIPRDQAEDFQILAEFVAVLGR